MIRLIATFGPVTLTVVLGIASAFAAVARLRSPRCDCGERYVRGYWIDKECPLHGFPRTAGTLGHTSKEGSR